MRFILVVVNMHVADLGKPLGQSAGDEIRWVVQMAEAKDLTFCMSVNFYAVEAQI